MITSALDRPRRVGRSARGFTLVELLVAMSLCTIIVGGVLSTFLMVVRSGMRASNYSVMEAETRRAFEQLGIDARMASDFITTPTSTYYTSGAITAFTLTIPTNDLSTTYQVTYGYDASSPTDGKFFVVPGNSPTATTGRRNLINKVTGLTFLRYDTSNTLIPAGTSAPTNLKHVQVSVSVGRSAVGVSAATQIIRSSAFTLRNISL